MIELEAPPEFKELIKDFNHLVPAKWKNRCLKQVGRTVVSLNRKRIRKQQNLNGSPFAARSKKGDLLKRVKF